MASPILDDPNFRRTVVLMLEHSDEGALGVVLNRPTELTVRNALPHAMAQALPDEALVYEGGPVEVEAVIILADFTRPERAASLAFDSVGVVDPESDPTDLAAAVRAIRAFGGYAGWAPGQLEAELGEEAWIVSGPDAGDVFTAEPDRLWSRVLDRMGGAFRLVARMPDDPRMN